jgi:hypothetical protein
LGEQQAELLLTAPDGEMMRCTVTWRGIYDALPPQILGATDRSALCGEGVALRSGVSVADNCIGAITLQVDGSRIDHTKAGVYQAIYTATDAAGNQTEITVPVYIYEQQVTQEMLNAKVDELLDRMLDENISREECCRRIYRSVQASLVYVGDADKSDWVRAAYTSLFLTGSGDCFSYFAATKALLERAGIEYIEIERTPGYTPDTHFWLLVNIAENGEDDRWYYFDPTELRDDGYNHSGCLLTLAQIEAYDRVRPDFYRHDVSALPPVCDIVITPTPTLGIEG